MLVSKPASIARRRLSPLARRWRRRFPRRRHVLPEFYAAQIGGSVPTSFHATHHYLTQGWRQGILPHPFTPDDSARHDLGAARRLRRATVLAILRIGRPSGDTGELVNLDALVDAHPRALRHRHGPAGFLLGARTQLIASVSVTQPVLRDDRRTLRWDAYLKELSRRAEVVPAMVEHGVVDTTSYELQTGHTFLSEAAALSHYLEVGEATGLAPNPFFEQDWYLTTVARPRKPGSGMITFWRSDQRASTAPHFDGAVYVSLSCADKTPPEGAFAHFLRHANDDDPTPTRPTISPRPVQQVREIASLTIRALADEHDRLGHQREASAPLEPTGYSMKSSTPVAVVIDARSLHRDKPLEPFHDQTHPSVRVIIIVPDDLRDTVISRSRLAELAEAPLVKVIQARRSESYGAAIRRAVSDTPLVAFWNYTQRWKPEFLARGVAALDRDPRAMAVTVRGQARWLVDEEPLWSDHEFASGVVVRPAVIDGGVADPDLNGGVEWDLLLRIDRARTLVVASQLIKLTGAPRKPFESQNPRRWTNVVRARHHVAARLTSNERVSGRVSALIPTFEDWAMTIEAVGSALASAEGVDLEVVVLDNGSRPAVSRVLAMAFAHNAQVLLQRVPRNTDFAHGSNLALAASSGEYVIFLNNDTSTTSGALRHLVDALEAGAVAAQPLLLYPSGTIQTAGTVFLGSAVPPVHLLANFPVEDVHPALAEVEFHALTAACLAMRASDAIEQGGFDTHFVNGMEDVDLCLRLRALKRGPLRVVPSAVVVHHESQTPGRMDRAPQNRVEFVERWRDLLTTELDDRTILDDTHLRIVGARSVLQASRATIRRSGLDIARPRRVVADGPAEGLPSLRWAIKTAVPRMQDDPWWGDLFFARDLAAALTRLGQEVVVDRLPANVRPESDHLDDVVLALRGLADFQPQPNATNLMWIISHPDDVPPAELRNGWDRVYAAGAAWAERTTVTTGVPVHILLQATAEDRFHPDAATGEIGHDVLFVGNTRLVFRPVVRDAVAAGADLAVYGRGWPAFIDAEHIVADHLPNSDLPGAYAGSRIVLNDHWPDMAANGFLSNRLFDAAASGARVITDSARGVEDVFGANVRVYRDLEDLEAMVRPEDPGWPSREERRVLASEVRRDHSFDARARTLLQDAFDLRGIEHHLRAPAR